MPARELQPVVGEVYADDPFRALQPRACDGAKANHSGAEYNAGRARLHLGRVDRSAKAGRKATGEKAGVVEWRLFRDVRQGDLRHHGVLSEGRGSHEVTQRLTIERKARSAVGEVALALLLADRKAKVGARIEAVNALAALRREQRHDMVADRNRADALTYRLNNAGALMTEHGRRVAGRVNTRGRVEVGVADAAGNEPHQHLAGLRFGKVNLAND